MHHRGRIGLDDISTARDRASVLEPAVTPPDRIARRLDLEAGQGTSVVSASNHDAS